MIYELRTYTMKPGAAVAAAKHSGEMGRAVRGDNYGKLEGYWMTEVGPLNQVMHLWSYSDLNERSRLRAELANNKSWNNDYLPEMRPLLIRQDIRLLNLVLGINAPDSDGNIYEFRNYRLRPGAMKEWLGLITDVMPAREKYSRIIGLWSTEAGQPNEVCHIWAYPTFEARAKARSLVSTDPEWKIFLGKSGQLIEEMNSTLMIPAVHSPLK